MATSLRSILISYQYVRKCNAVSVFILSNKRLLYLRTEWCFAQQDDIPTSTSSAWCTQTTTTSTGTYLAHYIIPAADLSTTVCRITLLPLLLLLLAAACCSSSTSVETNKKCQQRGPNNTHSRERCAVVQANDDDRQQERTPAILSGCDNCTATPGWCNRTAEEECRFVGGGWPHHHGGCRLLEVGKCARYRVCLSILGDAW